jgi:hypothetical protein
MAPLDDVIARIMSAGAMEAANMLLTLPASQWRAVVVAIGPAQAARLLVNARVDRMADLVTNIGFDLLPAVLAQLSMRQLADVISELPFELALRVAEQLPPSLRAELLLALPTQQRVALQAALPPPPGPQEGAEEYLRQVEASLARIASSVSWLDRAAGALVVEVFGRPIQVLVRYRVTGSLPEEELHAVVRAVDWRQAGALILVTNVNASPALMAAQRELVRLGYPLDVLTWLDERNDGELKRTLVRLSR